VHAAAAAGERGESDLGDFGVGDAPLVVLVVDRVRVADRGPAAVGIVVFAAEIGTYSSAVTTL